MTYIAAPVTQDSEVLNDIARDLIVKTDDPNKTMLRHALKVVTSDGVVHEVGFGQLDGLMNILDKTREFETSVTPLQYLIQLYKLDDLVEMGVAEWLVSEYSITVMHANKTVRFEGTLTKSGHSDKEFTFALGGFDFIQQFALSRVISLMNPQLKDVAGTYDYSYTYTYGPKGMTLKSLELPS